MRVLFRVVLLVFWSALLVGAEEGQPSSPPKYRMELVYIFETETLASTPESIIVIGNSGFRSAAALKRYVATLPQGAVLEWAPGCVRLGGELLLSSTRDLEDFKAFCEGRGIAFILHPSG
jgi:hypothetical protein